MGLFARKNTASSMSYGDPPPARSGKTKLIVIIILSVLFLLFAGGIYYYYTYKTNPSGFSKIDIFKLGDETASDNSDAEEIDRIVKEVKNIMLLPDETPVFATVTDLEKVKDQTFFKNAALGDKVLIFMQAKKAILYRPSQKLIVEVGTVNNPGTPEMNTEENISVEPTPIPETTVFLPETTPTGTPFPSVTQKPIPTPTAPLSSEY